MDPDDFKLQLSSDSEDGVVEDDAMTTIDENADGNVRVRNGDDVNEDMIVISDEEDEEEQREGNDKKTLRGFNPLVTIFKETWVIHLIHLTCFSFSYSEL